VVLGGGGGAYIKGNYEKAYEILSPYHNVEDDFAHGGIKYQLALLFYYGRGVTMNRPVANKLFEEAASLGWEDAQKYLSQFTGPYSNRT
jgi:TPR repeat protein